MGIVTMYCSDEELINNLRPYFDLNEQYSIPFESWLHTARKTSEGILLTIGSRKFLIHPETGIVIKEVYSNGV